MAIAKVNGVEVEFEPGMTVLQVAELAGEEIPRFCYHERLSIAGNCRMCLVEVKPGPPKPQASCALPAAEGQEIFTKTPMVKKAREGVMEFLLINHPLDCPICDQGGECDLQDQAMGYGRDDSRYEENKRAVEEKAMGPLIKTVMTRCIQCTRCVRFITEVAGSPEIGLISRGEDVEITTYLGAAVTSELSANVIDLCPVGALTSKPYAFEARPWELKKTESIDVMDALGSSIRVDARGAAVLRVLPRTNDDVNEEWISDKTRYAVDGLGRQRLDRPYVRVDGKLRPATWSEAFAAVAAKLKTTAPERIGVIAGDLQDAESLKATKDLFTALGVKNLDSRQDGAALGAGPRESWLFNSTIAGIENADVVLFVGANPRIEAPVLNARFRKQWIAGKTRFGVIGEQADLTFGYDYLGAGAKTLSGLAKSKNDFVAALKAAERPAIIIGQGALARGDGAAILKAAAGLAKTMKVVRDGWNGWNVLHTAAARVAGLDMGFVPADGGLAARDMLKPGAVDVLFLLGADECETAASDAFKIYLGTHGDNGAHKADVILPGAAYTEKNGLYVNLEGRVQMGRRAVFPKGEAKEDWSILRALSEVLGHKLPYDSLDQLRAKLFADHPTFGQIDYAPGSVATSFDVGALGADGEVSDAPFESPIKAFHLTNPIARASVTMAECAAVASGAAKIAAE
ncbi:MULTISPECIES: NADH-quinone oxidoreductase subunit NuoG [Caulobacter]|jgi:NADH-quinone oxidoreductase subunit G|uniref:NADH-quinone oxidoreductase n=1 Tax=Caulobacter vibrioides OR37 TaxID=1292034 RepID=R0EP65_CAUVI|nr:MULTISPECIES: NADH-quinone oxidoreductase subunit NuoG [Caulobacter]ENZ83634.1 NADH dehydrogenase subunit G [Caulobacter vibrioides OR37]MBQ1560570.1 NADH-quinone oxidoreductase subunit G [Caulobacter sp.]